MPGERHRKRLRLIRVRADNIQKRYRIRIAVFLLCGFVAVLVLSVTYQAIQTLFRLDDIEQQRDQWQQPEQILQALDLQPGNAVADVGCGSGYFALKLAPVVGSQGKVLAVDIRALPLLFLWTRAALRGHRNLSVVHSKPDDPHLPRSLDAVLISNTYHELAHPLTMNACIFRSLHSGGRLVVVDRGPRHSGMEARQIEMQHHELSLSFASEQIHRSGFDIIQQQDRFIDRIGEEPWWMIVAQKP